jgi:hypothetical protein
MLSIDGKVHSFQSLVGSVHPERPSIAAEMSTYPNPSRGETRISYSLAAPALIDLEIYDMAGSLVRSISGGARYPGVHDMMWDGTAADGTQLPSGTYICRLQADDHTVAATRVVLNR